MEEYIGVIKMFAGYYAPEYYAFCDGQILQTSHNEALFSILGNQYGGDGRTTFALPDLRPSKDGWGNSPRYIICVNGVYPPRQ